MTHILIPFLLVALAIGGILAWLRFIKGNLGIKQGENIRYSFPLSPNAIIARLSGMERRAYFVHTGSIPKFNLKDDSLTLPLHRWSDGYMTVARVAVIAHTWAQGILAEKDPAGYNQRERSVAQARVIPILILFVCLLLACIGRISPLLAFTAVVSSWVFLAIIAIPSQFREWKTIQIAKNRLKEVGLYPQSQEEIRLLNKCLSSLAWCRVAGFRHIVPK